MPHNGEEPGTAIPSMKIAKESVGRFQTFFVQREAFVLADREIGDVVVLVIEVHVMWLLKYDLLEPLPTA